MVLAQLFGELVEPVGAPRDKDEWVFAAGEALRELCADAGGSSGDNDGGVGAWVR